MAKKKYRLGTRKSALALSQSHWVKDQLSALGVECEIVPIESLGDKNRLDPLYAMEMEGPGIFTKQLEKALQANAIDLAVHSLKDLPTLQPSDLVVAAIPQRERREDVLIIAPSALAEETPLSLKNGARVGSSSLRREALLLSVRSDLSILPIRGNVPTRVEKLRQGEFDAIVLADAGLRRLNLDLAGLTKLILPTEEFPCAPGQGALAVEVRAADGELRTALSRLHLSEIAEEVRIERTILRELEGGCTLPLGVSVSRDGSAWELRAFLGFVAPGSVEKRHWTRFERFHLRSGDAEELVTKTVSFFRSLA